MSDVTRLLRSIQDGDTHAAHKLLPLVYNELRRLAASKMRSERPDHILQPTELVHEAYLRLVEGAETDSWDGRGHFFAAAAEAMRRILIESARRRNSMKSGGDFNRIPLDDLVMTDSTSPETLLEIDDALSRFAQVDPVSAELVKLRIYAGCSVTEAAEILGLSRSTAYDNWTWAKAWFACELADHADEVDRPAKDR